MTKDCDQKCGAKATCYGGGRSAGDWAGYYCEQCLKALGFDRWQSVPES